MTTNELNNHIEKLFGLSDRQIDLFGDATDLKMIEALKKSMGNVQAELGKRFVKLGDKITLAEMRKFNRLEELEKVIREEIIQLGRNLKSDITANIKYDLQAGYYHTGYIMETPLNINLGFKGLNPDLIRANILNPLDAIKWPDSLRGHLTVLNEQLRREITTGLIQGKGFGTIARSFRNKYEMAAYKAERIVRTESQRARSIGRNLGFDRSKEAGETLGMGVKQIWNAALDTRTRSEHRALDGKKASDEGTWRFSDGVTTRGPALSGVARHDINCRCSTFTQVGEVSPEFRRDNMTKQEIQYVPYEQWAKDNKIPFESQELLRIRAAA